jgi:hypothetical protein
MNCGERRLGRSGRSVRQDIIARILNAFPLHRPTERQKLAAALGR